MLDAATGAGAGRSWCKTEAIRVADETLHGDEPPFIVRGSWINYGAQSGIPAMGLVHLSVRYSAQNSHLQNPATVMQRSVIFVSLRKLKQNAKEKEKKKGCKLSPVCFAFVTQDLLCLRAV